MQNILKYCKRDFSSKILKVRARQLLDSRGFPTVEAEIQTNSGLHRPLVPSAASTAKYEALELRDGKDIFHGKSVL